MYHPHYISAWLSVFDSNATLSLFTLLSASASICLLGGCLLYMCRLVKHRCLHCLELTFIRNFCTSFCQNWTTRPSHIDHVRQILRMTMPNIVCLEILYSYWLVWDRIVRITMFSEGTCRYVQITAGSSFWWLFRRRRRIRFESCAERWDQQLQCTFVNLTTGCSTEVRGYAMYESSSIGFKSDMVGR